jgi:hypothetical protein
MFFCLMVLIGYLNYLTKKIIKYINA